MGSPPSGCQIRPSPAAPSEARTGSAPLPHWVRAFEGVARPIGTVHLSGSPSLWHRDRPLPCAPPACSKRVWADGEEVLHGLHPHRIRLHGDRHGHQSSLAAARSASEQTWGQGAGGSPPSTLRGDLRRARRTQAHPRAGDDVAPRAAMAFRCKIPSLPHLYLHVHWGRPVQQAPPLFTFSLCLSDAGAVQCGAPGVEGGAVWGRDGRTGVGKTLVADWVPVAAVSDPSIRRRRGALRGRPSCLPGSDMPHLPSPPVHAQLHCRPSPAVVQKQSPTGLCCIVSEIRHVLPTGCPSSLAVQASRACSAPGHAMRFAAAV